MIALFLILTNLFLAEGQNGGVSGNYRKVFKENGGGDVLPFAQNSSYEYEFDTKASVSSKVATTISLELNETNKLLPDLSNVNLTVDITYWDDNRVEHTIQKVLAIDYNKAEGTKYIPNSYYVLDGYKKVRISLPNEVPGTVNGFDVKSVLSLVLEVNYTRWYDMQPNAAAPTITTGSQLPDEYRVSWNSLPDADGHNAYQLEWAWIEDELSDTYGTPGDESFYNKIFNENSTRVDLPYAALEYNIPLYYDGTGKVYYRVRGVNVGDKGVFTGSWSPVMAVSFIGHNNDLNWQVRTSFAEEGKRKSVMEYFDGGLRSRQTVTKDNQSKNIIAAETFYDREGRPSIQVLPVPLLGTANIDGAIQYQQDLNLFNGQSHSQDPADFFDLVSKTGYPNGATAPLEIVNSTGAANYYNAANTNKTGKAALIPDANGYPYSVTRYTPDGTGRIMAQSGVGDSHRMGAGHETKYYYGTPGQEELDGLFGTEVGNYTHYFKNMVRDANGQTSISYVDMHGRTVATALAGQTPEGMLPVYSSDKYPNQAPTSIVRNLLDANTNLVKDNRVRESVTSLLVPVAGDYTFSYALNGDALNLKDCSEADICFSCLYDLEIAITDESGESAPIINRYTNLSAVSVPDCTDGTPGFRFIQQDGTAADPALSTITFSKTLEVGSYSVRKTLSISEKSLEAFKAEYLEKTLCKTFKEIVDSIKNTIPCAEPAPTTCETCMAGISNFKTDYFTSLGFTEVTASTSLKTEVEAAYDAALANCNMLCAPKDEVATIRDLMLADMTPPTGQYAKRTPVPVPIAGSLFSKYNIFSTTGANTTPKFKRPGTAYKNEYGLNDPVIYNSTSGIDGFSEEKFTNLFNKTWAESLLEFHPEIEKLKLVEGALKNSYTWIKDLEAITSFDEALAAGYVAISATTGLPDGDPFYVIATSKKDSISEMVHSNYMTLSNEGVSDINMWKMAYSAVMCKQTQDRSAARQNCVNNAPLPPYSGLSTGEKDAIWEQFKRFYMTERQKDVNAYIAEDKPVTDDELLIENGYHLHFPKNNRQVFQQNIATDGEGGCGLVSNYCYT